MHGTFDLSYGGAGKVPRANADSDRADAKGYGARDNLPLPESGANPDARAFEPDKKDFAISSIANCFVDRLRRAVNEARSIYLKQLQISDSPRHGGSDFPQAEVSTIHPISPENHWIFLRRVMCDAEFESALKDVQLTYRPKKARIHFKTRQEDELSDMPGAEWDAAGQLLAKDRFKEFKNDLTAELRKLNIKKPVLTLVSAMLGRHVYNLVMVHVSFDPDDRRKLDEIRQKYSASQQNAEPSEKTQSYRPEVMALIEKYPSLRPIIEKYMLHNGQDHSQSQQCSSYLDIRFFNSGPRLDFVQRKKIRITEKNPIIVAMESGDPVATKVMDRILQTNYGRIEDWRKHIFIATDPYNTGCPEDMFSVMRHNDGSRTLLTATPSLLKEGDEKGWYYAGVDALSFGFKITRSLQGEFSGEACLAVTRQNFEIGFEKAGEFLSGKAECSKEDLKLLRSAISRVHEFAELTAMRTFYEGLALKGAFGPNEGCAGLKLEGAPGIVNTLMVLNQAALAAYLVENNLPVIVRRTNIDFSRLKPDFKAVFKKAAGYYFDLLCGGTSAGMDQLLASLQTRGAHELIRKIGFTHIASHFNTRARYKVIGSREELSAWDRASFKAGEKASVLNQLQVAALCLGKKELCYSLDEITKAANEINVNGGSHANYSFSEGVMLRRRELRRAVLSRISSDLTVA